MYTEHLSSYPLPEGVASVLRVDLGRLLVMRHCALAPCLLDSNLAVTRPGIGMYPWTSGLQNEWDFE